MMMKQLIAKIEDLGYFEVEYNYGADDAIFFTGHSDDTVEIRARYDKEGDLEIHDRYLDEKHWCHIEALSTKR